MDRYLARNRSLAASLVGAFLLLGYVIAPHAVGKKPHEPVPGCATEGQLVPLGRGWTTIKAPPFPDSDPTKEITAFEVDPTDPNRIFATDSGTVMRSLDGGCTWSPVYRTTDSMVSSIAIPKSAPTHVYLGLGFVLSTLPSANDPNRVASFAANVAQRTRVDVLVSEDGGTTWRSSSAGLPQRGEALELAVSDSDPDFIYALVTRPKLALFSSHDAGSSWQLQSVVPEQLQPASDTTRTTNLGQIFQAHVGFARLLVDPVSSEELWLWNLRKVLHSTDGGASWKQVSAYGPFNDGAIGLDVFHEASSPSVITIVPETSPDGFVFTSSDGGETWVKQATPDVLSKIAFGDSPSVMFATNSSEDRIYRFERRANSWVDVTPPYEPPPKFFDLAFSGTSRVSVFVHTSTSIERYTGKL